MKSIFLLFAGLLISISASANDSNIFTANTVEGVEMTFTILMENEVMVGDGGTAINSSTTGTVTIPGKVNNNGKEYTVTSIDNYAFYGCSGLTSINIPSSVTSIELCAFQDCSSLASINIPSGVTSIGANAFEGCSSLFSIDIPNSVIWIWPKAFMGCSGLISVTIGNSVERIQENTFNGCSSLTSINIPSSVTSIKNNAFNGCSSLASINIPSSVTSIGDIAFSGCNGLTSIIVDSNNLIYDSRDNCNALIKTETNRLIKGCNNSFIPNGVTDIQYDAFKGCSSMTSVTIPESVTSIGGSAFEGCSGLKSINIPSSVTRIDGSAFEGCSGLTSVLSRIKTPFVFGRDAFDNISSTCKLTVPYGTKDAYIAKGWTESIFKGGIEEVSAQTVTVGAAGMAVFCSPFDLDFSDVEGLKAYVVTEYNPSTAEMIMTRVTEVPAGTGVVLKGAAGTYEVPTTITDVTLDNMLVGVPETPVKLSKVVGDYTNYVLASKRGVIGFYAIKDGTTIAAGKAYLPLPTAQLPSASSGTKMRLVFNDEDVDDATGIEVIAVDPVVESGNDIFYNLNGQRVVTPMKGIYIKNGKKVLVK